MVVTKLAVFGILLLSVCTLWVWLEIKKIDNKK